VNPFPEIAAPERPVGVYASPKGTADLDDFDQVAELVSDRSGDLAQAHELACVRILPFGNPRSS
jgi:hypothetical protein